LVISGETLTTDYFSSTVGSEFAVGGGLVGGGVGASGGYVLGATITTMAMEEIWRPINFWIIFPLLNLGAYP
jgi:hypothetical protein